MRTATDSTLTVPASVMQKLQELLDDEDELRGRINEAHADGLSARELLDDAHVVRIRISALVRMFVVPSG